MAWQHFGFAIGADLVTLAAFYPALHLNRPARPVALALLGLIPLASPFAIAPAHHAGRFIAVLITSGIVIKLYDLARDADAGRVPSARTYLEFVANGFWHVLRRRPPAACSRRREFGRMLVRFPAAGVAMCAAYVVFRIEWARFPFLLEHAAKALAFYAVLVPLVNGFAAEWRFLGQPALDTFRHPVLAVTPADFWRRWNQPTRVFLHEHVFRPAGGWRAPARVTLATFVVSGLMHEYVFGVAAGRVQYVQISFFLVQGVAAAATLRINPRGSLATLGRALTLSFNLLTSVLFFASVQQIVPFYVARG